MKKWIPRVLAVAGLALIAKQVWILETQGMSLPAAIHWPRAIECIIGGFLVAGWISGLWHTLISLTRVGDQKGFH